jgi:hypothetical protein
VAEVVEQRLVVQHRLVLAEHQQPAGTQREMEGVHQARLRRRLQVDQHVAAADHVEPWKRRVACQVMAREDDALAQRRSHLDAVVGGFEMACAQPLGQRRQGARVVDAAPGLAQGGHVQVGGEHLQRMRGAGLLDRVEPDHRDRVRLLAGGAAGDPHAYRLVGRLVRQAAPDLLAQRVERERVAPERGHRDQRLAHQRVEFGRVGVHPREVLGQRRHAEDLQPARQAAAQRGVLVVVQVDAVVLLDQPEQRVQVRVVRIGEVAWPGGHRVIACLVRLTGAGPGAQRATHRAEGHLAVRADVACRRVRHAAVAGTVAGLDQHQSAGVADALQAVRAVRSGARQHDARGPRPERIGQRREEQVDRRPRQRARIRLAQAQSLAVEPDVGVVRRDQDRVGTRHVTVAHLADRQGAMRRQDLGQHRSMRGCHVLQQHEAQPGVGRQAGQQRAQALQPAGRGTDAYEAHGLADAHLRRVSTHQWLLEDDW